MSGLPSSVFTVSKVFSDGIISDRRIKIAAMEREQALQLVRWARMRIFEGKSRVEIESELDELDIHDEMRSIFLDHAEESVRKTREGRKVLLNDGTITQIIAGMVGIILAIILLYTPWFDHGRGRGTMISVIFLGIVAIGNGLYWRYKANND